MDADFFRASRVVDKMASVRMANGDDGPMSCDLQPGPIQGQHWSVLQIGAVGYFATRQPAANPGATVGLYLVPQTAPVESLANAQDTTSGVTPGARVICIPSELRITRAGAGGFFQFTCTALLYGPLVVPGGWTLRFIANVLPGTATPGPGGASQVELHAHVVEEMNAPPQLGPNV